MGRVIKATECVDTWKILRDILLICLPTMGLTSSFAATMCAVRSSFLPILRAVIILPLLNLKAPKYYCEDSFEGGGWLLVRRVKQGSAWHPAKDDLMGTEVYGTYGTATSDSTFSIKWKGGPINVYLFATGVLLFCLLYDRSPLNCVCWQATGACGRLLLLLCCGLKGNLG
jgi:hypothetical protein